MGRYLEVDAELVAQMNPPLFTTEFSVESLRPNLDLPPRHDLVKPFDVRTMMWQP